MSTGNTLRKYWAGESVEDLAVGRSRILAGSKKAVLLGPAPGKMYCWDCDIF